ncbi:MAG: flagellar basal-body rod protein FlgF [Mariniblastus sp.]|jgi:flagellar basal-body rod protein FlgF
MINGLYSGATAMDAFSRQQELISSNLAHMNTPGHRRVQFAFEEKFSQDNDQMTKLPGMAANETYVDFSQGRLEPTGRQLDVAIQGEGFFNYQGETGTLYSRNGALFRSPEGQLVNSDGLPILSDGAPLNIPDGVYNNTISIDSSGTISSNGTELGKLTVTQFDNEQLLASENSTTYFQKGEAQEQAGEPPIILQGNRELSNSHPVTELINLIIGSRHFEAAQRAMRTISESIQENVRS